MNKTYFKYSPFFRVVLFFMMGVLLHPYLTLKPVVQFITLSLLVGLVLFFYRKGIYRWRHLTTLLWLFLFLLLGYSYTDLRSPVFYSSADKMAAKVQVISILSETDKSYKTEVFLLNVVGAEPLGSALKGLIYFSKKRYPQAPTLGGVYEVQGVLLPFDPPQYPNAFDYSTYLKNNRVAFRLVEYQSRYVGQGAWSLKVGSSQLKHRMLQLYEKHGVHERELAVLNALFLGDKSLLSGDQKEQFSNAGAMHILAVSGLHVGVIYLLFAFVINGLVSHSKPWLRFCLMVAILWFYAFLTGFSPSVLRASIMFTVLSVGRILYRQVAIYNLLCFSLLIIFLVDPLAIYNAGLWLSHLAVLTIVVFYDVIYGFLHFRFVIFRYVWSLIALSLAAQIGTVPLCIYLFYGFPNYFLLTNILLIPLLAPILILAICMVVFQFVPVVLVLLGGVLGAVLWLMNEFVIWIEQLPFAVSKHLSLQWYDLLILYMAMAFLILAAEHRRVVYLKAVLSCLIVFGFSFALQLWVQPTSGMVVVNYRNRLLVNCFSGRCNEVFVGDSITMREINYCFEAFWATHHLPTKIEVHSLQSSVYGRTVKGQNILLTSSTALAQVPLASQRVSYVVVDEYNLDTHEWLNTSLEPNAVVIVNQQNDEVNVSQTTSNDPSSLTLCPVGQSRYFTLWGD